MDRLCKAGFLASEMVFRSLGEDPQTPKHDTALVFMNSSSSLITIWITRLPYCPVIIIQSCPFVYTLANIVTGEVAIPNKIIRRNIVLYFFRISLLRNLLLRQKEHLTERNKACCADGRNILRTL
jgi:hypothetical protein